MECLCNSLLLASQGLFDSFGFRLPVTRVRFPIVWIILLRLSRIATAFSTSPSLVGKGYLGSHFCGITCSIVKFLGTPSLSVMLDMFALILSSIASKTRRKRALVSEW